MPSVATVAQFCCVKQEEGDTYPALFSPFDNQNETYDFGKDLGKLMNDRTIVEIGKKYGKNGAQVALALGIQNRHNVLPKSKTSSRIKSNLKGDLKKLNRIDKKLRYNNPSGSFGWDFYTDLEGKR